MRKNEKFRFFVEEPEGKRPLGRIKGMWDNIWIFKEKGGMSRTGFIRLRIGSGCRLL
jgi:hypothetical protein